MTDADNEKQLLIPSSSDLKLLAVGTQDQLIKIDTNLPAAMRKIAETLNESFPKIHDEMRGLENYKNQHEKQGRLDSFLTKGDMEKNRNRMVELTMSSAMKQMEVIAFIAWINKEMLRMQDELRKAQDKIAQQTAEIAAQNAMIKQQQHTIEEQQSRIEASTGRMAAAVDQLCEIKDVVIKLDDAVNRKTKKR